MPPPYRCSCPYRGFRLNETTMACEDINECEDHPNGWCEDTCENRLMDVDNVTHECYCLAPGLKLAPDGRTCVGKWFSLH